MATRKTNLDSGGVGSDSFYVQISTKYYITSSIKLPFVGDTQNEVEFTTNSSLGRFMGMTRLLYRT